MDSISTAPIVLQDTFSFTLDKLCYCTCFRRSSKSREVRSWSAKDKSETIDDLRVSTKAHDHKYSTIIADGSESLRSELVATGGDT